LGNLRKKHSGKQPTDCKYCNDAFWVALAFDLARRRRSGGRKRKEGEKAEDKEK